MFRARALPTALAALAVQILAPAPAPALERVEIDPAELQVYVEPQDLEQARAEGTDGSFVVGGHLGALPGCAGVQAFAKRVLADGSVAWAASASAGRDCDLDGQPDGGDPLFEDMTSLDPDYIVSSTVHAAVYAADGSSYFAGQLLVAWEDGAGLTAAWGAFVLHKGSGGGHLADLYVGPQPLGSPAQVLTCIALCSALSESSRTQWGGRALAELEHPASLFSGLVLAGWRWSTANQGVDDKDVFVLALDPGLQTAQWFNVIPYPAADLPLDVAVGDGGEVYATGIYGPDRDVFAARFDGGDGTLTHLFLGGGAQVDWGDLVEVTAAGEVEVEGTFTDAATFGEVTLNGDGPTRFRALLTPTLEPILIEAIEGGPGGQEQQAAALKSDFAQGTAPPSQPGGTQSNPPTAVEVLVGTAGSGTSPSLVSASDDEYLVLFGDPQPDFNKVEVLFEVPILEGASLLESVKLELKSDNCTGLEVLLGGGAAPDDVFYGLGGLDICPLDEPVVAVEIPSDLAEEDLGFSASSQPPAPLAVLLSMEVHGPGQGGGCSNGICTLPADDEQVDELMINSEFP